MTTPPTADTPLRTGDLVEIETTAGPRHVQVTHCPPAYPAVLRALATGPSTEGSSCNGLARRKTAFVAMSALLPALVSGALTGRRLGSALVPEADRAFPVFRLPIRDRTGQPVYWWHWDGDGLRLAPEGAPDDLPLREVMSPADLAARLAKL